MSEHKYTDGKVVLDALKGASADDVYVLRCLCQGTACACGNTYHDYKPMQTSVCPSCGRPGWCER